jgi:hypothetical protein
MNMVIVFMIRVFFWLTQVRLGTEKGAFVVRWTIRLLYSMLLVLGLTRILPLPCTVS